MPNVSTGSPRVAAELSRVFQRPDVELLDTHCDSDHGRSVFSVCGTPLALCDALVALARHCADVIDVLAGPVGQHPHVGALDVAPFVFVDEERRGPACASALTLGSRIGELGVPAFLYGDLTSNGLAPGRTRAQLRRGGVTRLAERIAAGELTPDFGPPAVHPRAGAVLVAARAPLVAFNVVLSEGGLEDAAAVAARIREGGASGLPGLRAIGVLLGGERAQVSMNVERPADLPLARVVDAVRSLARVSSAEIVGLVPESALRGFPEDVPIDGFDARRQLLEHAY